MLLLIAVLLSGMARASSQEDALCNGVGDRGAEVLAWDDAADASTEDTIVSRIRVRDIDGDGLPDALDMMRSRSPSHYPADPARIEIRLSSGGQAYAAGFPMIAVIRLEGHYYVRGVIYPEQPTQTKRVEVLRIDGHGLTLVCRRDVAWSEWY